MQKNILLTQTVQKGGCAAKVAASELRRILGQVKFPVNSPEVLVDSHLMDDAAVIRVTDDVALVQTLDFFTPIVDSPYIFGQIAAANALSDVYAMGGKPKTAMAILAFPLATMDEGVIVEVLQGGSDKIKESGADFVGGHSIDDDTLKFGLSVTGYVHPQRIWSNAGAKPGDKLYLTKPLGTGTATAALKRQEVKEADIQEELNSMCRLNSTGELGGVSAATDVTGFGLAGHALQMARASQVTLSFNSRAIPVFKRTFEFLERGFLTKAHRTNREYAAGETEMTELSALQQQVLFDPQTSGGLLISSKSAIDLPYAVLVGEVTEKENKYLRFI